MVCVFKSPPGDSDDRGARGAQLCAARRSEAAASWSVLQSVFVLGSGSPLPTHLEAAAEILTILLSFESLCCPSSPQFLDSISKLAVFLPKPTQIRTNVSCVQVSHPGSCWNVTGDRATRSLPSTIPLARHVLVKNKFISR